jgi:glycosyltransferase involved in cell wall biosynthesis
MRIGVNCLPLQASVGGVKQYFLTLFDWLLENDSQNEYIFFYLQENLPELEKVRSKRWRSKARLLASRDEIAGHLAALDLYFCPFNTLWPRPVSLPSVVTLADIQETYYPEFFAPEDLFNRARDYKASTQAADRVITFSEFSKQSISLQHRLRPSKIAVAYLCADPTFGDGPVDPAALDFPVPFREFILYPANRWLHKNHDGLLRALRILKDRGENINAVFTGFDVNGGYPLQAKAIEYGLWDCIYSAGYVSTGQLAGLYRKAEMTVFPSLFEGFGIPPVEAMAAGCPVAVATSASLPEVCKDAAIYFDPTDPESIAQAIMRLRRGSEPRASLIQRGQSRAKAFSPEAMAAAHLRAFEEAAACYSALRWGWQRYLYQPCHEWAVGKKRELGVSYSKGLVSGWTRKLLEQGLELGRDLIGLPSQTLQLRRIDRELNLIKDSGLFDESFYRRQQRIGFGHSCVGHYLWAGVSEGLDPNRLFDGAWYLMQNPDVVSSGMNPLVHFAVHGAEEGRDPHPLFDVSWYLDQYPDVRASGRNALAHYLLFGAIEGRDPHPLFQTSFYLAKVADYNQARLNPLAHYLGHPSVADPNPLFDTAWYLQSNPDVAASRMNPLIHYVLHGRDEGRATKPDFDRAQSAAAQRTGKELRRVVIDLTSPLPGGRSGIPKVMALELIRQFCRIAPACDFVLLTLRSSHDELASLDAHNVRRLCMNPDDSATELAVGSSIVRQLGADLLFCPFTAPAYFHPAVPTVCVVYDLQYAYYPEFFDLADIQESDRDLSRAIQGASKIICISEFVRHTLLRKTKVSPQQLEAIHIVMPRQPGPPSHCQEESFLKGLRLISGEFLLYPANFRRHKNHELLLLAFGIYRAAHSVSTLKLVLTGTPGSRRDFLEDAVRRLGLSQWVVFTGNLPEEELSGLLRSCMAVVFPSLFEGFGFPLVKAMEVGRPLLCSNTTSLPEVAGEAALFFDPRKPAEIADAIARISIDPDLRRELSAKGAKRLATFGGPEDMASRYLETFRKVVQQSSETSSLSERLHYRKHTGG